MKKIYLLVFCLPFLIAFTEPNVWDLKKDANQIQIYTRKIEGSSFREFKATTRVKTTLDDALQEIMYRAPEFTQPVKSEQSYFLKKNIDNSRVYYAMRKMPWPIRDRDVVTTVSILQQTDHVIMLKVQATPEELPQQEDTIRIEELDGFWLLEKEGAYVRITQQLHLEPRGSIPPFIINALIARGPHTTFSDLRNKLHRD